MLLHEKADQAEALLAETGLGCWLTFARETELHPDPGGRPNLCRIKPGRSAVGSP